MSLPTGSPPYKVVPSAGFQRDLRDLKKSYKGQNERSAFEAQVLGLLQGLTIEPRPAESRWEPWPGQTLAGDLEFRKLVFVLHNRQGAKGQGRLMYLVDDPRRLICLVYLYTHADFVKRPPDRQIRDRLDDLDE
jgi:hypothetical protein